MKNHDSENGHNMDDDVTFEDEDLELDWESAVMTEYSNHGFVTRSKVEDIITTAIRKHESYLNALVWTEISKNNLIKALEDE